jgi:hypothetical protein
MATAGSHMLTPASNVAPAKTTARRYNHLKTAWNARDVTKAAADECSEEAFYRWRQFPTGDIYRGP